AVVRAGDAPVAAAATLEQARAAMTADVAQRADAAATLAQHDDAVGAELEGDVVAGVRDLAHVAGDLPAWLEDPLDFDACQRLMVVDPGRERACGPAGFGRGRAGGG